MTVCAVPEQVAAQPVASIEWIDRDKLSANSWNPNRQAPPEAALLRISIVEDGWTQPIVVREHLDPPRLEIVDGYHRWITSEHPDVFALTGGLVPIVRLPACPDDQARLATVRHNRARGTHGVLGMAEIVTDLLAMGMSPKEVEKRLKMDSEEVDRLSDRGNMLRRGSNSEGFGTGWTI